MKRSIDLRLTKLEAAQSTPGWGPIFAMTVGVEPAGFQALWGDVTVTRKPGETLGELQERCQALHPEQRLWASV